MRWREAASRWRQSPWRAARSPARSIRRCASMTRRCSACGTVTRAGKSIVQLPTSGPTWCRPTWARDAHRAPDPQTPRASGPAGRVLQAQGLSPCPRLGGQYAGALRPSRRERIDVTRVTRIGNFVDAPPTFGRDEQDALRTKFDLDGCRVIAGVGRLHPVKGWDDLLRAFARLPAALDGQPLCLLAWAMARCARNWSSWPPGWGLPIGCAGPAGRTSPQRFISRRCVRLLLGERNPRQRHTRSLDETGRWSSRPAPRARWS